MTGLRGVPSDATAVVLNVTGTEATDDGFLTVYPSGERRPLASNTNLVKEGTKASLTTSGVPQPSTSNLNVEAAGGTVSNLAVVPVGADGNIVVFTQRGAHVIVDVAGWFSDDGTRGGYRGMFVPMSPTRVLDTRRTLGGHLGPVEPQGTVDVMIAGEARVPMTGAAGVIANLTAVNPNAAGYVTLFPNGTERALAASLNVERKDQIVPNLVASPIGVTGKVTIFHQAGGDLVLDVAGWFTS